MSFGRRGRGRGRGRSGVGYRPDKRREEEARSKNTKTVWIGDLTSNDLDEMSLTSFFSQESGFQEVKILKDKMTGRNLGYGFVEFSSHEDASKFLQRFAGQPIPGHHGRRFRLNWASFGVGKNDGGENFSVFVGDLASDITDIVLFEVFHRHYKSCSGAKVVMDTVTQKSRGYGFVKFESKDECDKAIAEMNGKFVLGRQIKVAPAVQKKDQQSSSMESTRQTWRSQLKTIYQVVQRDSPGNTGVYVGNLNSNVVEEDLFKVFSPFGQIKDIKIPPAELRNAYVLFALRRDAQKAIMIMNGKMVKDATIHVSWGHLDTKTICVNTLVSEGNDPFREEKGEDVWKKWYFQQMYMMQQQNAVRKYYLEKKRQIPGKRAFVHNFKVDCKAGNRIGNMRMNEHYKQNNFGNLYYFDLKM